MGILSTSWEWLIYESHTSGNCWIEKSLCLLFVYLTPKAALVLNPALLDMSASTHSDNQMNINYNNANNNDNGEWRGEKSCQFSNGHWQSVTRTSVHWKKMCTYTHIHTRSNTHTNGNLPWLMPLPHIWVDFVFGKAILTLLAFLQLSRNLTNFLKVTYS